MEKSAEQADQYLAIAWDDLTKAASETAECRRTPRQTEFKCEFEDPFWLKRSAACVTPVNSGANPPAASQADGDETNSEESKTKRARELQLPSAAIRVPFSQPAIHEPPTQGATYAHISAAAAEIAKAMGPALAKAKAAAAAAPLHSDNTPGGQSGDMAVNAGSSG